MKIRPIFKTIDIFSFIQFLSRQTNYIIKFFLLKVLYLVWLSLREIGRLLRVDHASVLRSIRCGLERLGTLAVGTRAEVRGLEELEERLMAHFNQLEPPEEALRPRPKAPARAPNPRRPPAAPTG